MNGNLFDDIDVFQSHNAEKRKKAFKNKKLRVPMQTEMPRLTMALMKKRKKQLQQAVKFGREAYAFGKPIAIKGGKLAYATSLAGTARLKAFIESRRKK